ncbi:helix-turn-helix domain-containing protein [Streptomyces sp. SP18BB07]|uniref:helix-turn-helix domain-containing protein n=1 Tax=Streptomyces sp. SP18BB07 TaxID=3002522 RepID=UPI002E770344|nr:helix-turn-helix domain-containing protein [Streptomyces sp. SP18BB07]MEE1764447.1 helix-turn-helix domain-containing protein [Streptomyces sp. SP18BB07]
MTIKHIAMVLEAEGLDGPEKLLMIAYCNRTDDHGYCWPGQQRLADDCGTSPATVKRVKKKLVEKKLIASQRRLDPKTGEPITNLTRVNLELLAAMKRRPTDYDDNVIERITFDADAPLPQKKRKAPKGTGQDADQVMAQDEPDPVDNPGTSPDLLRDQVEPDPQLKMSPTPGQVEPDVPPKLSPTSGQVEPLNLSHPPEKPQGTVLPSVGATEPPSMEGRTDGKKSPQQEIPLTEGVRFLTTLGEAHPKLRITGKPLRDQGAVVDILFARGWKDEVLWELLTRPLPVPLRKDVSAIIAKRLSDALDSPLPGPRRTWEDEPTPTPRQFTEGGHALLRRHECPGDSGLCGRPVEAEGELCLQCSRVPQSAW